MSIYTIEKYTNSALVERDVADTVAGTFTVFDGAGVQQSTRPLTTAEATYYAAWDATAAQGTNKAALQHLAQAALTANPNDVAQDQLIQTQAATITAASITNLATAATAIGKLAQAVSVLAGNDVNTKKELQAIVRLFLGAVDSTDGT